jgi:hydroxymethylpyrimidine pyrophosphatase-like HAD family hydrolase
MEPEHSTPHAVFFLCSVTRGADGAIDSASMKWQALATDYDGTIATDGVVDEPTCRALIRLRSAKVRTFLVTGRELSDFRQMEGFLPVFDMVIAENGAVLYDPASGEIRALGPPPPEEFLAELTRRGVDPLGVGRSIVATHEPHEKSVLEVIKELGLELQVIFNKGAIMILPSGVNKASGLQAALEIFGLSPANVIGVGDAENDHAFLELCGLPVAVANALPALKENAALVTKHSAGAGVAELIDLALRGDLDSHIAVEASQ